MQELLSLVSDIVVVQSAAKSCPTLSDLMDHSMPGLPVPLVSGDLRVDF